MNLFQAIEMSHPLRRAPKVPRGAYHIWVMRRFRSTHHMCIIPFPRTFQIICFLCASNKDRKQNKPYILNSRLFSPNSNASASGAVVYPNLIYMNVWFCSFNRTLAHNSPISSPFIRFGSDLCCAVLRFVRTNFLPNISTAVRHTKGNWLD